MSWRLGCSIPAEGVCLQGFYAFFERGEGAGDFGVAGLGVDVERGGALAFEEGEFEVVGEEEEL